MSHNRRPRTHTHTSHGIEWRFINVMKSQIIGSLVSSSILSVRIRTFFFVMNWIDQQNTFWLLASHNHHYHMTLSESNTIKSIPISNNIYNTFSFILTTIITRGLFFIDFMRTNCFGLHHMLEWILRVFSLNLSPLITLRWEIFIFFFIFSHPFKVQRLRNVKCFLWHTTQVAL